MKIIKKCTNCGKKFQAQMLTTKYCCHKCNQEHYRNRKKREKQKLVSTSKNIKKKNIPFETELNRIQVQDYLSISDLIKLLGVSRSTISRLLNKKYLKSVKFGSRVLIQKNELNKLFESQISNQNNNIIILNTPQKLYKKSYFYTQEIPDYYNISIRTVDRYLKEHHIKKHRDGQSTFVLKKDLIKIFGEPTMTPKKNG